MSLIQKYMLACFCLLLAAGCSPSTPEDCRYEAKGVMQSLIADLKDIQTREDLIAQGPKIARKSQALAHLMIQVKKFREKGAHITWEEDHIVSDLLMREMERIYHLEGGRELMESFQREALLKLDAFDQAGKK